MQPPQPPNGKPRLAAELLAVADALRHVAQRVERLERAGHPAVAGSTEAAVISCNAPPVVDALETLGHRLAIEQ